MLPISALIKYAVEGLAVGFAVYLVAGKKSELREIVLLGLTASVTFMVLDLFTAGIGASARQGAGFGIGLKQVGFGGAGAGVGVAPFLGEGFESHMMPHHQAARAAGAAQYPTVQYPIPVGEDVDNQPVGYNRTLQEYGVQTTADGTDNEIPVNYLSQQPYRFTNPSTSCPQKPVGSGVQSSPYGITRTGSRWMGWTETGKPINCNTDEYKVVPGLYAKYILQPGYHEGIKTYNSKCTDMMAPNVWPSMNPLDSPYYLLREPFMSDADGEDSVDGNPYEKKNNNMNQYGATTATGLQEGFDDGSTPSTSTDSTASTASTTATPATTTTTDSSATAANPASTSTSDNLSLDGVSDAETRSVNSRYANVIHSGDIIILGSGCQCDTTGSGATFTTVMQRGIIDSQIAFDTPLPNVKTNLTKVRFVLANKHDPRRQTPIKYGDNVFIKHNANVNNNNKSLYIKYGDRLQSHQEGQLFRVYKIVNKTDPKSQAYIKYGDCFYVMRGDQNTPKVYLKVETDKSVSSESTADDGTVFCAQMDRVFELYDRQLCICTNEILFP